MGKMTEEEQRQYDAIVRARQVACKHSMIKGRADDTQRCVFCGVSQADWEKMQSSMWGYMV